LQANAKLANLADLDGRLPIHWACTQNHLEIVRLLTNVPRFDPDVADVSGWTCLHIVSSLKENQGDQILDLLLSKDADVSLPTSTGATALHFATSKNNLDIAKKLIAHKASARVKDKRGQLALHRAAALGSVPLTKLLLANKSPINATDMDGMTALHHAISEGHGDVAVELLKAGAESDKRDKDERLAIQCAPDAKVKRFVEAAAERDGLDLARQ